MHPPDIFYVILSISVIMIALTIIIVGSTIVFLIFEIRKILQFIKFTAAEIVSLKNNISSGNMGGILRALLGALSQLLPN